jgi:hypothetical protein
VFNTSLPPAGRPRLRDTDHPLELIVDIQIVASGDRVIGTVPGQLLIGTGGVLGG